MNPIYDVIFLLILLTILILYIIKNLYFIVKNYIKIIIFSCIFILISLIFSCSTSNINISFAYHVIPAILLSFAFINISRNKNGATGVVAGFISIFLFMILIFMSYRYAILIADRIQYTNSPYVYNGNFEKIKSKKLSTAKTTIMIIMREKKIYNHNYKEGLVIDIGIIDSDEINFMNEYLKIKKPIAKKYWHTWFTGIYGVEYYSLWYPGGVLKKNIDKIDYL
jgi:hypothetical protein